MWIRPCLQHVFGLITPQTCDWKHCRMAKRNSFLGFFSRHGRSGGAVLEAVDLSTDPSSPTASLPHCWAEMSTFFHFFSFSIIPTSVHGNTYVQSLFI